MRNDEAGWEVAIAKAEYHYLTHPFRYQTYQCSCLCSACFLTNPRPGEPRCICQECPCDGFGGLP